MSPGIGWKQIYRGMAFSHCKDDLAAGLELLDSLLTLRRFLDGQLSMLSQHGIARADPLANRAETGRTAYLRDVA
jgi:hypothetical protein